jgi:hypothetical protein
LSFNDEDLPFLPVIDKLITPFVILEVLQIEPWVQGNCNTVEPCGLVVVLMELGPALVDTVLE